MTEYIRAVIVVTSIGGFAGMLVLAAVYCRTLDRRAPLPASLGIYLALTAINNATHLDKAISQTTWLTLTASVLALWAVYTTGLWGRPHGIATKSREEHKHGT